MPKDIQIRQEKIFTKKKLTTEYAVTIIRYRSNEFPHKNAFCLPRFGFSLCDFDKDRAVRTCVNGIGRCEWRAKDRYQESIKKEKK